MDAGEMFASTRPRGLLRWLLRELSTDEADMIELAGSIADSDDDDAQALLDELATQRLASPAGPLESVYRDGSQLLGPLEAVKAINIPRASFYALVKRGAFPSPVSIDDVWIGWPRDILLDWADDSARERLATCSDPGYAPFERFGARREA
jgi:predicted DNA-binding transcriptional regulator AlpA